MAEIHVLKNYAAPSVSGRSTIQYAIGSVRNDRLPFESMIKGRNPMSGPTGLPRSG
jgi:hypothetical protein